MKKVFICNECEFEFNNAKSLSNHKRFGCNYEGFETIEEAKRELQKKNAVNAWIEKKEKYIAKMDEYRKSLGGRTNIRRIAREQYWKHREKRLAGKKMNDAIKKGLLQRQPCEVCGEVKVDGHHEDYSKPLKVKWLCRSHHLMAEGRWKGIYAKTKTKN